MNLLSEPLHYAFFALAGVSMTMGLVQLCGHSLFQDVVGLAAINLIFSLCNKPKLSVINRE